MATSDTTFIPSNRLEQLLYTYTNTIPIELKNSSSSSTTSTSTTSSTAGSPKSNITSSSSISWLSSSLTYIILLACLVRMAMFSLPHSGQNKLPIGGDYEAQRHWMEITLNLPLSDWYIQTVDNDLLYWGLDYPPLTAYLSYGFGKLAEYIVPDLVIMKLSHLNESSEGKMFMRTTVLICDLCIWFPAVYLLLTSLYNRYQYKYSSSSVSSLLLCLFPLYFHPILLIIDHGHFQYNNVSLGLTIYAIYWLYKEYYCFSAIFFSLALNYKQMSLYHALVFFIYLIIISYKYGPNIVYKPVSGYTETMVRYTISQSYPKFLLSWFSGIFIIGIMVIITFAVLWLPFCFYTPTYGMGGCIAGLEGVFTRLFPINRNIFEDKVANLWCSLEPFTKFRQYLNANPINPDDTWSPHNKIAFICALTTLTLSLPTLALLFRAGIVPLLPNQQINTIVNNNGDTNNSKTEIKKSTRVTKEKKTVSESTNDTSVSSKASSTTSICIPSYVEHGILALGNVALAFFLSSYQVHEKSILLAAIPYSILYNHFPLFSIWFTIISTWTMWPLLLKDNLLWPMIALLIFYTYLLLPFSVPRSEIESNTELSQRLGEESKVVYYALRLLFPSYFKPSQSSVTVTKESILNTQYRIYTCCKYFVYCTIFIILIQSISVIYILPPKRLPDIHPYLSSVIGCCYFLGALGWGILLQLGWVYERITYYNALNIKKQD